MLEDRVPEDLKMSVSCDEEPEAAGELILTPSPEEEKPESTELILEAEEATPEETFFTDDRAENIAGAESLGINARLFTSAEDLYQSWSKYL